MWPFRKPKVTIYRTKKINWSKVTTVKQIVAILQGLKLTQDITVGEQLWNDPTIKEILGDRITKRIYVDGCFEKEEEEE